VNNKLILNNIFYNFNIYDYYMSIYDYYMNIINDLYSDSDNKLTYYLVLDSKFSIVTFEEELVTVEEQVTFEESIY
jgi:hypothetical protein